ncbi:Rne/Rng family ribonuclease [Kordiimonas sp.]|uniref:Rne/Rng family ribonuclease n=1 Tax=Kordiimonas sp. TaxID=1970157 RepID=UPI003A948534
MSTRMLIDARHSEETRVTVVKGSRVEEFDYESATRRQLKGNIYLARVTRVEPSLQAAFVEYGGNRHGFLAFSEIHPDYYQIPVEDREELIAAETEAVAETMAHDDVATESAPDAAEKHDDEEGDEAPDVKASDEDEKDAEIEEAAARRRGLRALKRKYNIQEVIKRRQVLLVQVVKEERGNKGAALTTYLSLAGRYCVLMPNSTHSGGISRKISSATDRKRLKKMISDMQVPEEMGLIVRTAGMKRTKAEVKRDYEYLLRLWNGIRELTLQSVAPALVYEEGNLIKRTIRDLYTRDVDEILVEGDEGYRAAKDFMKLLMPSHAKKVQHYKDRIPLFHRYQVENHLEAMYQPVVQLRSGGYIVINPTEALISIDVNSGRATREHNIEETALKTNMEAAEEVARQLRLRDMAGLVVIDFIDMEERNNNRAVERRMKDVLKNDRARIQVGRISSFGLMEMSRQRLRPNLLEASMETCNACGGTGVVRSVESAALMVLRQLEEEGIRGRSSVVRVTASPEVAIYLLNKKRAMLSDLESSYDFVIEVLSSPSMAPAEVEVTREAQVAGAKAEGPVETAAVKPDSAASAAPVAPVAEERTASHHHEEKSEDDKPRRKRRRRRRRRRGDENTENAVAQGNDASTDEDANEAGQDDAAAKADGNEAGAEREDRPRRRRGSRGGRRRRERTTDQNADQQTAEAQTDTTDQAESAEPATAGDAAGTETAEPQKPARRRRRVVKKSDEASQDAVAETTADSASDETAAEDKPKPRRRTRKKAEPAPDLAAAESDTPDAAPVEEKPKRRPRRKAADKVDAAAASDTPEAAPAEKKEAKAPARRRRAPKKADEAEATVAAEATPKAPVVKSEKKAPAKPAAKKPAAKDKPVQSIKVSADAGSSESTPTSPAEGEGGPKRKGWWQRTFG